MLKTSSSAFSDTKPHYELLDGLRGVAALLVIWYHVFEGFATSPIDQRFNHGYLAVDFFFILSGFVIGYAYDDRWRTTLTLRGFFRRRLIRLHPMVVLGAVLGAVSYLVQGSERWDGTPVPLAMVLLALLLNFFLIPVAPGAAHDVRGNNEMYPLNGPSWSLFFEYIGNILYALFLRRMPTAFLAFFVGLAGVGLASYSILGLSGYGHLGVGWSLIDHNLLGGLLRLLFSFGIGLVMSRVFKPVKVRGAFWLCTIALAVLFAVPHVGGADATWQNGIYDAVCTIVVFPCLVYIAASGKTTDKVSSAVCKFLGDISYPIYIIHYPSMYLYYSWLWKHGYTFAQTWPVAVGLFVGNIILAYACLKLYDEPVRRWLSRKFMRNGASVTKHN